MPLRVSMSPHLPVSPSPRLRVSPSPCLPVSLSPCLPVSLSPRLPVLLIHEAVADRVMREFGVGLHIHFVEDATAIGADRFIAE